MGAKKYLAHLALITVALIYGINYTVAKNVLDGEFLTPKGFIFLRIGTGALLFIILQSLIVRKWVKVKDLPLIALCGLTGTAINQLCFFEGLSLTTPIHASLIMLTIPFVVLLLSVIFLKNKMTLIQLLGIVIGAIGAGVLIIYGKESGSGTNVALGDFLVFINASSYAIYLLLVKDLLKKYDPITVISYVFMFGFLFVLPITIGDLQDVDWSGFSKSVWWAIAYVLLFTTFFAYLLNIYALNSISPMVVSAYVYLQPLVASTVALITAKEFFSWEKPIAGILIFLGVFLISRRKKMPI